MTTGRLLLLLLLCLPGLVQAALEASVDRTRLVEGDTLELTLESPASSRLNRPDLTPLEQDFEVQGTRQLSLVSRLEGRNQPVTRWIITLLPRHSGLLEIPALVAEDAASAPIAIEVLSSSQAAQDRSALLAPVFIDSEVDERHPYVQAQVVLTLRIYHSVSLYDDNSLSGLEIDGARVQRLGEPQQYTRIINGIRHGVSEVRYAIWPQRSGLLDIPSQLFSANVLEDRDPDQRFSPRTGRLVQVRSPSLSIEVRPIPPSYPANAVWLPAREVQLRQNWQPDPGLDLLTGEPLTRSLLVQARGLSPAQLPELASRLDDLAGMRQYADQPLLEQQIDEYGIIGIRTDSAALVAQQAGQFQLPEIRLPWWNTLTDQLETATLEPLTLSIISEDGQVSEDPALAGIQPAHTSNVRLWPWQLATLLLGVALGASLLQLWRTRRQLQALELPEEEEHLELDTQNNPLTDLQAACRSNQPADARKALEAWARRQHSDGLIGLSQQHAELGEALDDLNACLFGQSDTAWRGKSLWRAVRMVIQAQKREEMAREQQSQVLDTLYPQE